MISTMITAHDAFQDFSRPLEMLRATHARIRRQCEALGHLTANLKKQGCDSAARETSAQVIRKLDAVSYYHKEDEEQDLLPRMMAAASRGRGASLTRMVTDITTEHRLMQRAWTDMRAELQALAAGDRGTLDALAVDRFIKLYRTHILMEEAAVYPLAEMLLSNEDLAAIGAHMAHRRSISPE
jgi:pyridoxamine 5'-phosphate oxidase